MTLKKGDKIPILVDDKMGIIYEIPSRWYKINQPKREILVDFYKLLNLNNLVVFISSDRIKNVSYTREVTEHYCDKWNIPKKYVGNFIHEVGTSYCKLPILVAFQCLCCRLFAVDYSSPFKNWLCYECNINYDGYL